MTLDKANIITRIIYSCALSASIILGGAWVLIKFDTLNEILQASEALKKVQLENQRLDVLLSEKPAVDVSITASQYCIAEYEGHFIKVTLNMQNKGGTAALIRFNEGENKPSANKPKYINKDPTSFFVALVSSIAEGKTLPVFGRKLFFSMPASDDPNKVYNGAILRSGEVERVSTVVAAPSPGLYIVQFYALKSSDARRQIEKLLEEEGLMPSAYRGARWGDSAFVSVMPRCEEGPTPM